MVRCRIQIVVFLDVWIYSVDQVIDLLKLFIQIHQKWRELNPIQAENLEYSLILFVDYCCFFLDHLGLLQTNKFSHEVTVSCYRTTGVPEEVQQQLSGPLLSHHLFHRLTNISACIYWVLIRCSKVKPPQLVKFLKGHRIFKLLQFLFDLRLVGC